MATFLSRHNKKILLLLADEFETNVSQANKVREIIRAIEEATDYEENLAKAFLDRILAEEERLEAEQERRHKLAEQERLDKLAEKERLDNIKLAELEIEKLRVQNNAETGSMDSTVLVAGRKKINLKDMVPKFDPKVIDITLFLMIFERQARKYDLEEDNWVSQLIPLLPADVVELIVKEPSEKADDFSHMKQLLLKRFRLGAGALKSKFQEHNRKPGALWSDLVYELRGYLENWLEAVNVNDFESLKELMLAEQIKNRVPFEIKDKFLDEWDEIKSASVLAEKCDKYESIRGYCRKPENKNWERKIFNRERNSYQNSKFKGECKGKMESSGKKDQSKVEVGYKDRPFEKKRNVICYECHESGHIRPDCHKLKKKTANNVMNLLEGEVDLGECFKPYLKKALINGIERNYLRDTGAAIDLCDFSWVNSDDLLGETTWVRQPLDNECKCLPLARVTIQGQFGTVITKAAVKPAGAEQGFYLLGNKTAELIEQCGRNPTPINAVITRSQMRAVKMDARENEGREESGETLGEAEGISESDEAVSLPEGIAGEENSLVNVTAEEFCEAQRDCQTLKALWERCGKEGEIEFIEKNGKLLRVSASKRGEEVVQICVPLKFRERVLILCHELISGHLGVNKTKNRVLKCYYWPNCYKEIEEFVKTCDTCQRVGHNKDKVKAPLQMVPIISEVFTKINLDAVGPLPLSSKGNRYLITSICIASKYPDAIPVENIISTSVISALLEIFSRTGYPKEIQCDLGRSFTSELTTEFFSKFGIRVRHSSVCHPQSNSVERFHSTLKKVLKALCLETGKDWETCVPMALFALRTITHDSIGFSPAELVHGKNLRMPHTIVYENWLEPESVDQNVVDYILTLVNRLKRCQSLAEEKMIETRAKRKLWYDKNAVSRKFQVGDKVLVLATSKPNKMAVNWVGPGTVTAVISETNYTIDLPEKRDKSTIYHVNLMKPYHSRPEFINLIMEQENEEIEENAEIPYPIQDHTHLDFWDIVNDNKIELRASEKQIGMFRGVIGKYGKVFSSEPGTTSYVEMDIELNDDIPVRAKPYRMSPRQTEILREEIKRLVDLGVIEIGQSDYASPMILVETPGKDPRPCVDYRRLNAKTRTEFFPLPNIEEVVEKVSAADFITVMDLTKGYFQIPLTKRAQRYAAFVTPFGMFIPKK